MKPDLHRSKDRVLHAEGENYEGRTELGSWRDRKKAVVKPSWTIVLSPENLIANIFTAYDAVSEHYGLFSALTYRGGDWQAEQVSE